MEDKYQLFSCQERIELSRKLGVTEQQVNIDDVKHLIAGADQKHGDNHDNYIMIR